MCGLDRGGGGGGGGGGGVVFYIAESMYSLESLLHDYIVFWKEPIHTLCFGRSQ